MNILQSIMAERKADADAAKAVLSLEALRERTGGRGCRSLAAGLQSGQGTRIIAETKKASPSAGVLRADYRPAEIARAYAEAGAAGISVLTEPRHFQGSEQHLRAVRAAVDLPVLRKDFMCDAYHVCEAAAWGADVVLLIVAALDETLLHALHEEAARSGLDVLAETHTEQEVDRALGLEHAIIGVNSRNLKTLKTDLSVARRLAERIPADRVSVAESGIRTRADIVELEALGYNGFLVGQTLMQADSPAGMLKELLGE